MNTAILDALVANPSVLVGKLFAEALPGAAIAYALVWWVMRPKDGRKVPSPFLSHAGGVFASVTGGAIFRIIAMATFAGRSAFEPAADTGAAAFYIFLVPAVVAAGYIAWLKSQLSNQPKPRKIANSGNDAYAEALSEIEEGRLDKGVWARAFAEAGGDEPKAKALYIKARVGASANVEVWEDTQPPTASDNGFKVANLEVDAIKRSPRQNSPMSAIVAFALVGVVVIGGILAAFVLPAHDDQTNRVRNGPDVAGASQKAFPYEDAAGLSGAPKPAQAKSSNDSRQDEQRDRFGGTLVEQRDRFGGTPIAGNRAPEPRQAEWGKDDQAVPVQTPTTQADWEKGVITPPPSKPFSDPNFGKDLQIPSARDARSISEKKAPSEAEKEHYRRIYAAHPDADQIAGTVAFQAWVGRNSEYQRILKAGTAQEIIAMFTAYKKKN